MQVQITKTETQSALNTACNELNASGTPFKRTKLQDAMALILTEGDRKWSSLMSDWKADEERVFSFSPSDLDHSDYNNAILNSLEPFKQQPKTVEKQTDEEADVTVDRFSEREREDPLMIPKTSEEKIPKHIKIEAAKSFAGLYKNPILGLVAYEEGESVPESVWLEIWDYIWGHLESESGEEPYIELSQFDTKSGHTEIFNVGYIGVQFLWQCDKYDIREWTAQGVLDAFELTGDELLEHPDSRDVKTSKEWAEEFAAHCDDPLWMPDQFFILTENEVDFNPFFKGKSIAGHISIWPKGEWLDDSYEAYVTPDALEDADDQEEAEQYLREFYQEGVEWIEGHLNNLGYLTKEQKSEAVDNFLSELSFYLHNSLVGHRTSIGFTLEQESDFDVTKEVDQGSIMADEDKIENETVKTADELIETHIEDEDLDMTVDQFVADVKSGKLTVPADSAIAVAVQVKQGVLPESSQDSQYVNELCRAFFNQDNPELSIDEPGSVSVHRDNCDSKFELEGEGTHANFKDALNPDQWWDEEWDDDTVYKELKELGLTYDDLSNAFIGIGALADTTLESKDLGNGKTVLVMRDFDVNIADYTNQQIVVVDTDQIDALYDELYDPYNNMRYNRALIDLFENLPF